MLWICEEEISWHGHRVADREDGGDRLKEMSTTPVVIVDDVIYCSGREEVEVDLRRRQW